MNLDLSPEPDSGPSSDSDTDPDFGLRVPGPGYVLVKSEGQVGPRLKPLLLLVLGCCCLLVVVHRQEAEPGR